MSNLKHLGIQGSASLPAIMFEITSAGTGGGTTPPGGAAPGQLPLVGYLNITGATTPAQPVLPPPIPAATVDETRIIATGDGCTDITSTVHGRDNGSFFLDTVKRIQLISRLSLYRFQLPLAQQYDANPKLKPRVLTRQDPPDAPLGFKQLAEDKDWPVTDIIRFGLFGGARVNETFQWNLGNYVVTRDMVYRGRIVDILMQLAEPYTHCEQSRPVILAFTQFGFNKVYIGRIDDFPGNTYNIDYADAKITHWERREYRGPRYGLVTITGAINPATLAEFDQAPEFSEDVSYNNGGHIIQRVTTAVYHRPIDNAVVQINRFIYGPDPDSPDDAGTAPSSGEPAPIHVTLLSVEIQNFIWEPPIVEPKSGQIVNRPVLLQNVKTTTDGHGEQTGIEITSYSYDVYKRQVASLTLTKEIDPTTNTVTFEQSEAKTYPQMSLITDYVRIALGDIEALTHIPGGAGSMPQRGLPFLGQELIDDGPGAVDVTIQNEFLTDGDIEGLIGEFDSNSGKNKIQFYFESRAMPWLRLGDKLNINGVVDASGAPVDIPSGMVVADLQQDFDVSNKEAKQMVTLQIWR